jgi:hypothetical protein
METERREQPARKREQRKQDASPERQLRVVIDTRQVRIQGVRKRSGQPDPAIARCHEHRPAKCGYRKSPERQLRTFSH